MIINFNKDIKNLKGKKENLSIFKTIKIVFLYLNYKERILGGLIAIGNIVSSLFETVALVSVMPIVKMIIGGDLKNSHPKILVLYDFLEKPKFYDFVFYLTCISIFLLLISIIFSIFMQWLIQLYRVKCQNRLAELLCFSILKAPYEWHLSKSSTKNAHHLFNDILVWSSGGINSVLSFFSNVSLLIFIFYIIIYSMGLAGFFGLLLIAILALIIIKSLNPIIQRKSSEQREFHANSYSIISEILFAIKDIKLSNKLSYFMFQYIEQFSRYGKAMSLLKILQSLPSLVFLFIGQCTILLTAIFMFKSGMPGVDVATNIALIILIVGRGIPATNRVLNDYVSLSNAMPSLNSLIRLNKELEIINPRILENKINKNLNWTYLKFQNVFFKYTNQNKNVLKNINLEIKKGNTYCIIGATGSGKTTFLDLFLGLLNPSKGNVFLDCKNFNKSIVDRWQKLIAYVPQNTVILNKNAYENMALGLNKQEMNEKKINILLESLELFDDVFDKYKNIRLGEFGKKISGGQKQRLSLARALYKNCPILVLDEITSALDNETEKKIIKIIKKLKGKFTIICVTHKPAFLEMADTILEIKNGNLVNIS